MMEMTLKIEMIVCWKWPFNGIDPYDGYDLYVGNYPYDGNDPYDGYDLYVGNYPFDGNHHYVGNDF